MFSGEKKKQNPFLNLSLDCYFLEETHLKGAFIIYLEGGL